MPGPRTKAGPADRSSRGSAQKTGATPGAAARGAESTAKVIPVLQQFRELFRASQQHFQRIEANCGVTGAQLWALSEVEARPGVKVSELARALSVHLSTASNLLDKLEAKGLVRRARISVDQRVVTVVLTADGRRVLESAPRPAAGIIPDALAKMPDDALGRLHRDLGLLLDLASVRNPKARLKPLAEP